MSIFLPQFLVSRSLADRRGCGEPYNKRLHLTKPLVYGVHCIFAPGRASP